MQVKLVNYTQDAKNLLLFTKNTRLMNVPDAYEMIKDWSDEKKQEELDYMLQTIKSSWEFVDYTFEIRDVSRAFTHQFVRNRMGSYAQQSQRTVDMEGFGYTTPIRIQENDIAKAIYDETMVLINKAYQDLKELVPAEDARGVLPTNIHTNIVKT
jgi:thymidylate synthase ThyX